MKDNQPNYSHPSWLKRRDEILRSNKPACVKCGVAQNLHVHHKYYTSGKQLWEYSDEAFEVLCHKCHANEHGILSETGRCLKCDVEIDGRYDYCFKHFIERKVTLEKMVKSQEAEIKKLSGKLERERNGESQNSDDLMRELVQRIERSNAALKIERREFEKMKCMVPPSLPSVTTSYAPYWFVAILIGVIFLFMSFNRDRTYKSRSDSVAPIVKSVGSIPERAIAGGRDDSLYVGHVRCDKYLCGGVIGIFKDSSGGSIWRCGNFDKCNSQMGPLPWCEICHSKLLLRNGKNGQFWGCSAYPKCKKTYDYIQ